MQRCNPAPADGCFEPAVKLGQALETGDLIGAVVGPLGERLGEVRSHESGIVLVLRTLPSVRQGDSVAVILPLATQGANHG
jgi:predicted deacylase